MINIFVVNQSAVVYLVIILVCGAIGALIHFFVLRFRLRAKKGLENGGAKEDGRTYEQDRFNRNLYYSLAYRQLRLLESYSPKHKDRMIVSTSRPHLFSEDKLREFYDTMPEIATLRIMNKHDIMVVKSPAADYGDFNAQLRQAIIQQLNENYIPEFQKDVKKNYILRHLPESDGLCLKALSGNRTIKTHIDPEFENLEADKPGVITPITSIRVDELMVDSCFFDIFQSLPGTWNDKKMTQDQVVEFCMILPDYLIEDRRCIFFLIPIDETKSIDEKNPEKNLEVLELCLNKKSFSFTPYGLDYGLVWYAKNHPFVVSPLLQK